MSLDGHLLTRSGRSWPPKHSVIFFDPSPIYDIDLCAWRICPFLLDALCHLGTGVFSFLHYFPHRPRQLP